MSKSKKNKKNSKLSWINKVAILSGNSCEFAQLKINHVIHGPTEITRTHVDHNNNLKIIPASLPAAFPSSIA